jgi:hypothetical protein
MTTIKKTAEVVIFPLKKALADLSPGFKAALANMKEEYEGLKLIGPTDKDMYLTIKEAHTQFVKPLRTGIEAQRKAFKQPAIDYGKSLDAKAKEMIAEVKVLEDKLIEQREIYEKEEERLKQEKIAAQIKKIADRNEKILKLEPTVTLAGYTLGNAMLAGQDVEHMTDSDFSVRYMLFEEERERIDLEAEAKKEADEAKDKEMAEMKAKMAKMEAKQAEEDAAKIEALKPKPEIEIKGGTGGGVPSTEFDPFDEDDAGPGAGVPQSIVEQGLDVDAGEVQKEIAPELVAAVVKQLLNSSGKTAQVTIPVLETESKFGDKVQITIGLIRDEKKFKPLWDVTSA